MSILFGLLMTFSSNTNHTITTQHFPLKTNIQLTSQGIAKTVKPVSIKRTPEEIAQNPIETMQDIARKRILERWNQRQSHLRKKLPKKSFVANVSAYTAASDECGKSDGITASGVKVKPHTTLACPPEYPFGTKVKIDHVGTFVCEDRGGAIKGNRFDIYVETKREAFAFGRQHIRAEVLL